MKIRAFLLSVCVAFAAPALADNGADIETKFRFTAFADSPGSDSTLFNGRADAFVTWREIWPGATLNLHGEYVDGEGFVGLGTSGVIWPTNVYAAVPQATGKNNATLSFTLTQELSPSTKLTFGKFNVVELARGTPIAGGKGTGGFQYTGIAAPPSFVFPPYVLGASLAHSAGPFNYSLMIYDPNNAQGHGFWRNLFSDGVTFNGTVTYKTKIAGLNGNYTVNLIHSTAEGTDYTSLATDPGIDAFSRTTRGITFAAIKFQQFLFQDVADPKRGWGVFGQIGFGDGNPNQLDNSFVFGVAGTGPTATRANDRWGIAWSRYNWSDALRTALIAGGGAGLEDEWAVEAFYEAEITDALRLGGNIIHVAPGTPGFGGYTQVGLRARLTF